MNSTSKGKKLAENIKKLIIETNKEMMVAVCEEDDNNAISRVIDVEYDEKDNRIYIKANYSL